MSLFDTYVGIDYSGRGLPEDRLGREGSAIAVFMARGTGNPTRIDNPYRHPLKTSIRFSRRDLFLWLARLLLNEKSVIVGIDHAFSLTQQAVRPHGTWDRFLYRFSCNWATDRYKVSDAHAQLSSRLHACYTRAPSFRLTETWTPQARSVFDFNPGPGNVAFSTHAGLPWIYRLYWRLQSRPVAFWPFQHGFVSPNAGDSAVVEVYPAIVSRRYCQPSPLPSPYLKDDHDAYSITRWLQEKDRNNFLVPYFSPSLTRPELSKARLEGWILGLL